MARPKILEVDFSNFREPFPAQQRYITSFADRNWFIGGRGCAKSISAVIKNCITQLVVNPKSTSMIMEMSNKEIKDILYPLYEEFIPDELYKLKKSDNVIEWINGSKTLLRSAEIGGKLSNKIGRGRSLTSCIIDEAALIRNPRIYNQIEASIRSNNPKHKLYLDLTTTPAHGWIRDLADKWGVSDHKKATHKTTHQGLSICVNYARTYDNPHNNNYAEKLIASFDSELIKQEIDGAWITLGNRVFEQFSDTLYPYGNILKYKYNPELPYYLSMDIGSAENSMIIWQRLSIDDLERWVIVGEHHHQGGVDAMCQQIKGYYVKSPKAVYIGHDATRRDAGGGSTPQYYIHQWFGYKVIMYPLRGNDINASYRYSRVRHAIKDIRDDRRLLVADDVWTAKPGLDTSRRGVKAMFENYCFSDYQVSSSQYLPHDKYSHCYDAISFFVTQVNPTYRSNTLAT